MINKTTLSVSERTSGLHSIKKMAGSLLDIVAAFIPLLVLGIIGTRLGVTTLLGGFFVNLAYVASAIVAWAVLRMRGSSWREIGLARPQSWRRTVLLGIGAFVGAVIVSVAVQVIALNLPGVQVAEADVSRFNPVEGNMPLLLFYLLLSWTTIAFGEEMFYRAFLTNRLAEVFQNTELGWAFAAVGSSVAFGLAHYANEGPMGIVGNGAFGLLFALIYLRTGRNLWVTIIAHGLLNTLRFVLVFSGAA
jgi:membrane protease YdiL (CAAX protease family)